MSFNNYARKVRNTDKPILIRRSALRSCIRLLVGPDGPDNGGYHAALARFDARWDFQTGDVLTERQLLNALVAVEVSRNVYLERLRAFERRRIREKAKGKRSPSRADLAALRPWKEKRMTVSLDEFLRTGNLGDLRLGMSKEEVQTLLGLPDDTGNTSRKYPQPSIFLYGTVEFWFRQQQPRELIGVWWEAGDKGAFRLTPAHAVTDWAFTPEWTFEQVEDYLRDRDMSFEYRDLQPSPNEGMPSLILPSGVAIHFHGAKIYGVHGWA